jgi:hypothetical protein
MNLLEIKQAITDEAISRQEELYKDLMDEANVGGHDGEDFPELETGEAGHESESVKMAAIRREEADEVRQNITSMKNYKFTKPHDEVEMLALIKTNRGNFFISKALKPVTVNGEKYYLLAPDAPIYSEMVGKKKGDSFSFNNISYTIEDLA